MGGWSIRNTPGPPRSMARTFRRSSQAAIIVVALSRLLPEALGSETSAVYDSFSDGLLDCPHYTRPAEFRGWKAPDVLLSGHHGEVARWRRRAALRKTLERRPDLLATAALTDEERRWVAKVAAYDFEN